MERSSIPVQFEELKSSGNLPSPTGVGMRILELTQTDDYSAEDMAEAIMSDPSLTGRILQLANSASVAGNEAVTTVSGAIMRLGGATVRSIALAFSLVSEREAGACRPFDYERYWSLSLARAVGAQELAKRTGVSKPEEAYIAGLLAEVGMLALASVHSTRYGQILIASQGKSLGALRQAEQDEFDID
ncbi:MAG: HDOD domain-containing protein, partial [Planctomycetota bacterium]